MWWGYFKDCPIETLELRDVKGLYQKALAGEIPNFTGVSDPYERPQNPHCTVESEWMTVEDGVMMVLNGVEEFLQRD